MHPHIYLIGNAHLDPAWAWQWQEGFAEIKATFRSALDRMKEFDGYVFTAAGASYYQWVEENAPSMFEEIRQNVAEGRWVIAGGWWLQPDCNLPCGESFARHGLYAQRYFYEKFGKIADFGYNVDSFGHNGALPQLLAKCGMHSYVMMRPEAQEKMLDRDTFFWEGIDKTRILTYRIPNGYGTSADHHDVEQKYKRIQVLAQMDQEPKMFFYGVGNHGGGPTIATLQLLEGMIEKDPALRYGSPLDFFAELREKREVSAVVTGDLQHHAIGCYSANSEVKRNNRRSENRLLMAEKFMTLAHRLTGMPYSKAAIQRAWEDVLFNQFHDILGGCSLKAVYDDAREFHGEALKISSELLNHALQRISWSINTKKGKDFAVDRHFDWNTWENEVGGSPIVIFNPNPWETVANVPITRAITGLLDENDQPVSYQNVRADKTFNSGNDDYTGVIQLTLPPMGYRTIYTYRRKTQENPVSRRLLQYGSAFLENDWYLLRLNPTTGSILSLFSKESQREIFCADAADAQVIEDFQNDTWAHGQNYLNTFIGSFGEASLELINRGPLFATLRATSRYHNSTLLQDFTLYRDRPGIEVSVHMNWQEPFKILKLAFPVAVQEPRATYEIPYGNIQKECNGMEEAGQMWFDVSGTASDGQPCGVSIVTNASGSYSVDKSTGRFVAIRSTGYADHFGIKDAFTETMDIGIHEFQYRILPHAGALDSSVPTKNAQELLQPPVVIYETYHQGSLPLTNSFVSSSAENVLIRVVKLAEDRSDLLVRAYETNGIETDAELDVLHYKTSTHFAPFEIKTIQFSTDGMVSYPMICELPL